jgi:thioredoxin-related protein
MSLRLIIGLLLVTGAQMSLSAQNKIRWMSWEEALSKHEKAPRKLFIDVYTEWCGWCKKMEASTFGQDHVAKYINQNYYAIRFDAEDKSPIEFKNNTYNFVKTFRGGYHELAAFLLQGKLSYPSLVFLDEDLNLIQTIQGFQDTENFDMIIHYFAGDHYKTTPWRKFTKSYVPCDKMGHPAKGTRDNDEP